MTICYFSYRNVMRGPLYCICPYRRTDQHFIVLKSLQNNWIYIQNIQIHSFCPELLD